MTTPPRDPSAWISELLSARQATLRALGTQATDVWLDAAPADARTKAQWQFTLRQVQAALSPANFLATNPQALQLAVESGGASLAEGMHMFLQDLAKGRVSMSDDQAFEVGRNVATPLGSVVFENELMQLIQYAPVTPKVYQQPLLIVPPCINKFYILDLQPENSLVAHTVAQGHTVFLVSWRNVSTAQEHLRWDDYLEQGVIAATDVALAISGVDRVNTLGFRVGGTLLACALAVLAARGEQKVSSMTLLTTMLDFHDTGEIGLLVDEDMVERREAAIGHGGLLQGRELAQVFASLRANDLFWPYVINEYLKGKAPPAFDLLFWNGDDTNLPGPMLCRYLRNACLENQLRGPGATVQCGEAVDFGHIDVPAFLYASRDDHIVSWRPHRRRDQPARQGQAQPLGGRGRRRAAVLAGRRAIGLRELVASLDRMARRACRGPGRGTEEGRQPQVLRHRARTGPLRQGKGGVRPPFLLFTVTH